MNTQGLESKMPGRQGCASLEHPDTEVDTQTCSSPEASTSKPEEALVAKYEPMTLISGAGHDALAIAKLTKVTFSILKSPSCIALQYCPPMWLQIGQSR